MDIKRILQALDGAATTPVAGANDMSKFLSIIDKNDVDIIKEEIDNNKLLKEGANPHKVSLPVQMAMQHYQLPPAEPEVKKPSLLKQYFAEAEEQQAQELADKQEKLKMYSQKIASRVLESSLKDKEDLKSKRKALQDIQMDPHTHKDPELKTELAKRKADLEKEAKEKNLSENAPVQQAPRDEKVIQQEIKALSKTLAKVDYAYAKAKEITREIKYDDTASSIISRIRQLAEADIGVDSQELQYAEQEVFNAIRALESAVYGLDDVFKEAVRSTQGKIDDLEGEIDEIQWNKKYGRTGE
jgi:hypothetical protein